MVGGVSGVGGDFSRTQYNNACMFRFLCHRVDISRLVNIEVSSIADILSPIFFECRFSYRQYF